MRLKDPEQLRQLMEDRGTSQAALAREVGVHRSFINHLVTGHKRTCSDEVGLKIEEALNPVRGQLFDRMMSNEDGQAVPRSQTVSAA